MKPDYRKITQVINYIAFNNDGSHRLPELKAIKLIWAADRYHLRKYARTVTGDNYVAMGKGPVGSSTKDIIEFETNYENITDENLEYTKKYIKFEQENDAAYTTAITDTDMDELSETDKEALSFALRNFGKMSKEEIIEFTHLYPEWKIHEAELKETRRVVPIDMLDFFKDPDGIEHDPFNIPQDILETTKELYEEYA